MFCPDRLAGLRKKMGITKAEAARKLNLSAMGYGRYENGDREPSFQTVSFIAQVFGTTAEYLYGETEDDAPCVYRIDKYEDPELFMLVQACRSDENTTKLLLAYLNGDGHGKLANRES